MNNSSPQGWQECKLGNVVIKTIDNRGKNPPYSQIGHEVIETSSISGKNKYPDYSVIKKYVSQDCYDSWFRAGHPQKGDVIIISVGNGIGNVCIMNENRGVLTQNLIGLRINQALADSDFIYYYLSWNPIQDYLKGLDIGSAQPSIKVPHLLNTLIPIPPLPEQRAIAGVLSSLDDKIDLLHRQNKTLEELAEALWRKMFVEKAEVGWKKGRLGDVVEETIGGDWGEDIESNDLIPVICLRGVDLQHIKESGFSSEAPIRFIKPTSLEKRKLNENEILIAGSGIGPIGKSIPINSALLKCYSYPVIYSNFCKRLRAESKEMAYFIEFMIYQFYKEGELDQFHMGTSVPNFNLKDFLNYEITIPPRDIISFFSSLLTAWYTKKLTNQIRTLSSLRDTLLPKLMSGEVMVNGEV